MINKLEEKRLEENYFVLPFKRIWRNWYTRMIQVHMSDHVGSSPTIRTIGSFFNFL